MAPAMTVQLERLQGSRLAGACFIMSRFYHEHALAGPQRDRLAALRDCEVTAKCICAAGTSSRERRKAGQKCRKLDGPRWKLMVLFLHLMTENMKQAAHCRDIAEPELRSFVETSLQSKVCAWQAWRLIVLHLYVSSIAYRVQGLALQLVAIQ